MRAVIKILTAQLKYILIFYIVIQCIYIFWFSLPLKSDSLYYFNLALSALGSGSIYPSGIHLNEDYIIAPLFVNFQMLILSIYNSQYTVGLFHLTLNLLQLLILSAITKKYFSKEASDIFILLYIFYLPNIGFLLLNMTELLFGVLVASSIFFLLRENKSGFFISGLFAAASVSVRPLGWALIPAVIIYQMLVSKDQKLFSTVFYILGVIIFFIVIGTATFVSSGQFVITSVNYGTNFLIGANDEATGAYNDRVFEHGRIGYIEKPEVKSYIEKQQFWFDQGIKWISKNTIEWFKVFPSKLIHIFVWDDYAISPLLHMQEWNLYRLMKSLLIERNINQFFENVPLIQQITYILLQISHHIYYFLIVTLFFYLVFKQFRKLLLVRLNLLILLVIGFSMIIPLLSFGDPRFKYPYILLMMIVISPVLCNYFFGNSKRE